MMISSSFRKIETKQLNSDPRILIFLVLRTTSPAAYTAYVNIRSSHEMKAAIRGLSWVSLKKVKQPFTDGNSKAKLTAF